MAQVKPLRLKSQKVGPKPELASRASIAQVLVETPTFHLSDPYDYLISQRDDQIAAIGSLVKINFSGRDLQGYIVGRREFDPKKDSLAKMKYVDKVISEIPVLTSTLHNLLRQVSLRYGSTVVELLSSALPERSAAAERAFLTKKGSGESATKTPISDRPSSRIFTDTERDLLSKNRRIRLSLQLTSGIDCYQALVETATIRASDSILIVVPDQKDIELLSLEIERQTGESPLNLGTHLSKSQRYENFLRANFDPPKFIVGTRSAIFTDLPENSTILVLDDTDESMYERRAPGWNVRDVALLRANECSVVFVSSYPSLEISRLVSAGWMRSHTPARRMRSRITSESGHRSVHQVIRDGLAQGSVLVTTSHPGYITSFLCQQCKNPATCTCGGKLTIVKSDSPPACSLCSKVYLDWRCTWCGSSQIRAMVRGAGRIAQEFGKAFPGVTVITSTAGRRLNIKPDGKVLVIATLGCEPHGHYRAAVLLDGEINFNRVELRSEEVALSRWLRAVSLASNQGEVYISLPTSHPVTQAMTSNNFSHYTESLLTQREQTRLPPYFRCATIQGEAREIAKMSQILNENPTLEVLGPLTLSNDLSKIVVRVDVLQGQILADLLLDLRRLRSIKGLSPFTIRIDPYAI